MSGVVPGTAANLADNAIWRDQVRWLSLEADNAEEPAVIAALALIGLSMIEERRQALTAYRERGV